MDKDTVKLVARWLAVVPGALLAMVLSSIPLHLVLYQTLTGSGIVEPYPEMPERLLTPLVAALAFIWFGSRIAPRRRFETAVTLFGVLLFVGGGSIALGLSGAHIGNVQYSVSQGGLAALGAFVGALIGLYAAYHAAQGEDKDRMI